MPKPKRKRLKVGGVFAEAKAQFEQQLSDDVKPTNIRLERRKANAAARQSKIQIGESPTIVSLNQKPKQPTATVSSKLKVLQHLPVDLQKESQSKLIPSGNLESALQPSSLQSLSNDKLASFVIGRQQKTRFHIEKEQKEKKKQDEEKEVAAIYDSFVESFDAPKITETYQSKSSNLFVGNLAPDVTEDIVRAVFSVYGSLLSVKIIWPRTQEEFARGRNSGFVAFSSRQSAETAFSKLNNFTLHGRQIHLAWGKPLENIPPKVHSQQYSAPKSHNSSLIPPRLDLLCNVEEMPIHAPHTKIAVPVDTALVKRICTLAKYVALYGASFENRIYQKELGNPKFNFLYDVTSNEHTFYLWRVCSFVMQPSEMDWRKLPWRLFRDEKWLIPPEKLYPDRAQSKTEIHKTGAAQERDMNKKSEEDVELTDGEKEDFCNMLKALTISRESICNAMGFCYDHSEAADQCAKLLLSSTNKAQSPNNQIAHLYVISDVLHNSSSMVKNAAQFHNTILPNLGEIFESLNALRLRLVGRITTEAVESRVLKVLAAWEDWMLIPSDVLNGFEATFLRPKERTKEIEMKISEVEPELEYRRLCTSNGVSTKGTKTQLELRMKWVAEFVSHRKQEVVDTTSKANAEYEKQDINKVLDRRDTTTKLMEDIDGKPMDDEDIDGEPMDDEDIDGKPMDDEDIDGEPMDDEDIDGKPMDDEDIDGKPMDDEDIDGQPMDDEVFDGKPMDSNNN